jgi:hypothetical protein
MARKHVYTVAKNGLSNLGASGYAVAKFDRELGTLEATYEVMKTKRHGLFCDCRVGD